MAAMLIVGVAAFATFAYETFKRRRNEMVAIERKHAFESMRMRLENVVRSSDFIEKSFIDANPTLKEYLKGVAVALKAGATPAPLVNARDLKFLDPDGQPWVGAGVGHQRGDLLTCKEGANCFVHSQLTVNIVPEGYLLWTQVQVSLSSSNPSKSGHINPQNAENSFTFEFPLNFYGNKWESHTLQCRSGFRAMQVTAKPVELLCADIRDPASL
jgi:hypothetical protein